MATQPLNSELIEQESVFLNDIRKWSLAEEKVLKQKSRINWINSGDSNTKTLKLVEEEFISSFTKLMGTAVVDLPCPNVDVIRNGPYLSYQQRCLLIIPITDQEIVTAMEGVALDKTPGIDGFLVEFFTKHCTTVKEDVLCVVRELFTTGKLLKEIKLTAITLVPKQATPTQVADYRPIDCCPTIYQIITKILTNRIKPVIGSIVSPSQSAFIDH
ncbi:hypothetical protein KY285_030120 [Solanum tuberosum]|nr:hypothetical protein KY285_030120 [Solanum tuberosum]